MATSSCVLCTAQPVTRAHIVGVNNLLRLLPPAPAGSNFRQAVYARPAGSHSVDQVVYRPIPSIAHMPVRVLCDACNGGWMNRIELSIAPILDSAVKFRAASITLSDQLHLATWTAVGATLSNYLTDEVAEFPQAFRAALRDATRPPRGTTVWLGSSHHPDYVTNAAIYMLGQELLLGRDRYALGDHHYYYWCILGPLVLAALIYPPDQPDLTPQIQTAPPAFTQIWPPVTPVHWPVGGNTAVTEADLRNIGESVLEPWYRQNVFGRFT